MPGNSVILKFCKRTESILFEIFQDNAVAASNSSTTCSAADLESIKQEILKEMKTEMNKMKQEIIEGSSVNTVLVT